MKNFISRVGQVTVNLSLIISIELSEYKNIAKDYMYYSIDFYSESNKTSDTADIVEWGFLSEVERNIAYDKILSEFGINI